MKLLYFMVYKAIDKFEADDIHYRVFALYTGLFMLPYLLLCQLSLSFLFSINLNSIISYPLIVGGIFLNYYYLFRNKIMIIDQFKVKNISRKNAIIVVNIWIVCNIIMAFIWQRYGINIQ